MDRGKSNNIGLLPRCYSGNVYVLLTQVEVELVR